MKKIKNDYPNLVFKIVSNKKIIVKKIPTLEIFKNIKKCLNSGYKLYKNNTYRISGKKYYKMYYIKKKNYTFEYILIFVIIFVIIFYVYKRINNITFF